ncbi:efflux transporter outer membrane subunit [Noviherbaspirillum saxi]|uniref:Efflux transporter outer membrane subunit n=1 Tax=Noviherbaspirillum saxi TaxID=2320863 RepID=A0A3A3G0H0_9BURK|nr:efflux transporter outer membrane subunit [Noviherbaspirillum saxi]RJF99961.1 efflux transporter outer membrane subunit [Noviherbaspirillum saxi]
MNIFQAIALACLTPLLTACAIQPVPTKVDANPPAQWHAPLPHDGNPHKLAEWWNQHNDPLLTELIAAAQEASPTVSAASARIAQARANRVAAAAALLPTADASLSATRARSQPPTPTGSALQAGMQTAWEIDLFGGNRAGRTAAEERLAGAEAGWHEARVSVAAELASQYYSLRSCELLLAIARSDAGSRAETARLAKLSAEAGFQSPANAALARASAADANSRATQQQAQCELDVKALVALTAISETPLRQRLGAMSAVLPQSFMLSVDRLPANVLAQRPDIFNTEREVAAASADLGSAQAQRYPRLTLSGSLGATRFRTGGAEVDLTTWSIGPLALSVPVFDGGRRIAIAEAARARYDDAVVRYRAQVRQAVREVEQALVSLQSTSSRSDDARIAAEGYRRSFAATEALYGGGLASLVELEESRRTRLAAELAVVSLQRERIAAWIALYRAAGGGWNAIAQP